MEERLRKFAKIVETKNYTKAAQLLHTSQPALSVAMQKLERELGGSLFARKSGALTLTPLGKIAYDYSRQLAAGQQRFKQQLSELTDKKPQLSIGMIDSLANTIIADENLLANLDNHAHLSVFVNNSRVLLGSLERGELDIACVVDSGRPHDKSLQKKSLGHDPLIGVVHATLPKNPRIVESFIAYDEQSFTGKLIQARLRQRAVTVRPVFHSTSPEVMLHLVRSKRGYAVLPFSLVSPHLDSGELHTFTDVIVRPIAALSTANPSSKAGNTLCAAVARALQTQHTAASRY